MSVTASAGAAREWFTDRAKETGLDFVHFNGMSGEFYYPEVMSPGVALFDYDNDGDLDVYLVQGQMLGPGKTFAQALVPPTGPQPLKGRLYRNDLKAGEKGAEALHFTDVTDQSGLDAQGYGVGVAAGDVDNDGCVDLYLTYFSRRNQLYRNNCHGGFTDISTESGVDHAGFSAAAAFVDYDRDGRLDLYVANYVEYTVAGNQTCINVTGVRTYCPPRVFRGLPDRLYRNIGGGRFADVTAAALGGPDSGPGLGVATADFNGDGWMDIFVANDGSDDFLWMNQRDGSFKNTALLAGVAVTVDGQAEASMGADAGDFDNDGDEDIIVTELTGEGANLYVNDGTGSFEDRSAASGIGPKTLEYTGFGAAWCDFDNDGWLDILTVNGMVQASEARTKGPFLLDQPKQLLRNMRNGRFEDVSSQAGSVFQLSEVGRGAAFGDIDNDGDIDVLVGNDAGPVRLLVNNIGNSNHWVGLRLVGKETPRDMLGAGVGVVHKDGSTIWRRVKSDGSYASANDPRVVIGLGDLTDSPKVRVRWPNGQFEEWSSVELDRYTTLTEGSGR